MFVLQIVTLAGMQFPMWMQNSRLIRYLCEISYAFFFAQFFTWKSTMFIIAKIGFDTNVIRIVFSFLICMMIAIVLHEIFEKPLTKYLLKRLS
ncbi:hypothetical protein SAMN02910371_00152 [Butyrivibrio sp. INlla14]|nr:hypothetical protein SAMN02910371_00152 [Butyrivibrio sp. INlla14]